MAGEMNFCFGVAIVISIVFLVIGFMDLMAKPAGKDANVGTISRQLKGLAYLLLSQVVLVIGVALCMGGLDKAVGSFQKMNLL